MTTKVQSDMYDIDGATVATVAAADKINFFDVTDSLVKEDTVQGVLDLVSAGFTQGTEQATTSGSSVTFGSIPAGVDMVIINFAGVSLSAADNMLIQLGSSSGIEASGYTSGGALIGDGNSTGSGATTTSGFHLQTSSASGVMGGQMTLTLEDAANYTWCSTHIFYELSRYQIFGGGHKSLSGELTQVKIAPDSGNFDAGAINIMYM